MKDALLFRTTLHNRLEWGARGRHAEGAKGRTGSMWDESSKLVRGRPEKLPLLDISAIPINAELTWYGRDWLCTAWNALKREGKRACRVTWIEIPLYLMHLLNKVCTETEGCIFL